MAGVMKNGKRLFRGRWFRVLLVLMGTMTLLLVLTPIGAKYYLAGWLRDNGADTAVIETLKINPFTGRIIVGGVEVAAGGRSLFHNDATVVDFSLLSLLDRTVHLKQAEYRNLFVDLEQLADGSWRIGSYTLLPDGQIESDPEAAEEVVVPWAVQADRVILEGCRISLKTPGLALTLVVDQAELLRFTTRAGHPAATLQLAGRLADRPLRLHLEHIQLVPELQVAGSVFLSDFELATVAGMVDQVLPTWSGFLGVDGEVSVTRSNDTALVVNYAGQLSLSDLTAGSAAFAAALQSLHWDGTIGFDRSRDRPQSLVTDGVLTVAATELEIGAQESALEIAGIEVQGRSALAFFDNDRITVAHNGGVRVEEFGLRQGPNQVREALLSWTGRVDYDSHHDHGGLQVDSDGQLELGPLRVSVAGEPEAAIGLAGEAVRWQGVAGYGGPSAADLVVELDGSFKAHGLEAQLPGALSLQQQEAELELRGRLRLHEMIGVEGEARLALHGLQVNGEEQPLAAVKELQLTEAVAEGRGVAIAAAQAKGLQAWADGALPVVVEIERIDMGDLASDDLAEFRVGELRAGPSIVAARRTGEELVRVAQMTIRDGTTGERQAAAAAVFEDLVFMPAVSAAGDATVAIGAIELRDVGWQPEVGVTGESLHLSRLSVHLHREADGGLAIARRLASLQEPATPAATPTVGAESGAAEDGNGSLPLRLESLLIDGDSTIVFDDQSMRLPFSASLKVSRFTAGPIITADPAAPTEILLNGELEGRAPVQVTGTVLPFLPETALDLQVSLKNYPLRNLSAYTVQSVGTGLASGQMQLTSTMQLAEGRLQMDNTVELLQLETETIAPELAAELDNQLPLPLDGALAMLRDSKGNITLDVPLNGSLDDLQVGLSDVLITALGKAIVPAASGYLMYALGPYGALAYVGVKLGEKMLEVTLPPVSFAPGAFAVTAEHDDYLQRLAMILKDRPEAEIQLCPVVGSWELLPEEQRQAIGEGAVPVDDEMRLRLLDLGQQRGEAVRDALAIGQGIDRARLLICDTRIDPEKQMQPAVLVQMY
ncbi:MAG: DUF748 domain-containing protein [Desulfofustis sp.]|jgi:hypothetical protein|nr:DUF748 domain-containing protein [Desulfofustis sp.]